MTRGLHWFRNDLRLGGNSALGALVKREEEWLPVFVLDRRVLAGARAGMPRNRFRLDCLARLSRDLEKRGVPLLVHDDPNALQPDAEMAADFEEFRELLRRIEKDDLFRRDLRIDLRVLARSLWIVGRYWNDHLQESEGLGWKSARNREGHRGPCPPEFIHRFGIAGPLDEAIARFQVLAKTGIEHVRVAPGSRDMPPEVGARSIRGLSEVVRKIVTSECATRSGC